MTTDILIRLARPEDAAALLRITTQSVHGLARGSYTADQIDNWMNGRTAEANLPKIEAGQVHVALLDGACVGYIDVVRGEINRLFILPDYAGQGVGRALMEMGLSLAREGDTGPVCVEATVNAEPFYTRLGFVTVGHGYFSGGLAETPPIEIVKMELA